MNVLDKINVSSDKIIEKSKLTDIKGGSEYDCCYLMCDGEYMGMCGADGLGLYCMGLEVPDESCGWIVGSCDQCE